MHSMAEAKPLPQSGAVCLSTRDALENYGVDAMPHLMLHER